MANPSSNITPSLKASRPARLLVVDDNPLIRELHAIVLRARGYHVTIARDGVEALEQLAGQSFDLVVTDQFLPGVDGITLLLALRSAGSSIPVIVVSESIEFDPLPPRIARELSAILTKPANPADFLSAIARALQFSSLEENAAQSKRILTLAA